MKRKAENPSIPALLSKSQRRSDRMIKRMTIEICCLMAAIAGQSMPSSPAAAPDGSTMDQATVTLRQGEDLSLLAESTDAPGFDAERYKPLFRQEPIADTTFERMRGRSFAEGCTTRREDLRYLFIPHYDGHGRVRIGEMVCHRAIADDLLAIFRELFDKQYAIERMRLIDDYDGDDERSMADNNTSCFNYRRVGGSRTLSLHARGMAVDINPLYNPMVDMRKGRRRISPAKGVAYADRSANFRYKITAGDAAHRAFRRRGFSWGGSWRTKKDYQHFQKR